MPETTTKAIERQLVRRADTRYRRSASFIGPVNDQHKWALYERAELFLLPSYSENFGIVVAEAMPMACPVLLTPEVGIAPLVQAAGAGVVTDGAPEKLAAVIEELLSDPARRLEMGRRGAEAARVQLSWSDIAAATEAVYREVLHPAPTTANPRVSMKRQLREVAWVVAGQAGTALGTLIGVRILTQFLSPNDYGIVTLATGLSVLATNLVAPHYTGRGSLLSSAWWRTVRPASCLLPYYVAIGRWHPGFSRPWW